MIALLKFKGCTYYVIAERRGLGALHLITVLNIIMMVMIARQPQDEDGDEPADLQPQPHRPDQHRLQQHLQLHLHEE